MKYRGSVGPKDLYDIVGAQQFCVMVKMGMRDTHKMLDFGCGSLRGGRFFIPYLLPGNYHGVEPNKELLYAGIENELGWDAIQAKNVTFYHFDDWMMAEHLERNMFDYILIHSILAHSGKDLLELIISGAATVLKNNGCIVTTFFEGKDSNKSGWLGTGNCSYSLEYMEGVGIKNNLHMTDLMIYQQPGTHQKKYPAGQKYISYTKYGDKDEA